MRIGYLVVKNIQRGGGIEKYTYELGSRLAAKGHEITVYSMAHYGAVDRSLNGMIVKPVFAFKAACLQKLSASLCAAADVFLRPSFDIVHLHSVGAGAFGFLPRARRCKTVLQMHGIEWRRSRWGATGSLALRLLEKASIAQASACTAVSRTQCAYLADGERRRITYIPTATEIKPKTEARELCSLGIKPGNYILFASRLVAEKGAHFLVEAFKRLKTDMKLVVAGDAYGGSGYKKRLLEAAAGDSRVLFPGYVEGRLLEELFSNAYLFVQPSMVEGLSIALLEAMSYGNCCVVSDIPENVEALGGCGRTFKSESVEELVSVLGMLIDSPEEARRTRAAARDRVSRFYTWDHVAEQMEVFYEDVVGQ